MRFSGEIDSRRAEKLVYTNKTAQELGVPWQDRWQKILELAPALKLLRGGLERPTEELLKKAIAI